MPLLPWQQWLACHALERREGGTLRFRNIVVEVARQNGKSLFSGVLALYTMYLKDRKSTRLNSSHVAISYAVFCLKKKKVIIINHQVLVKHQRLLEVKLCNQTIELQDTE